MINKEKVSYLEENETNPIRILHFLSSISISSGVASVIMNYYRHIDRSKVQFDFLYFNDDEITYKYEIKKLGGNIYKINKPNISKKSICEIKNFFKGCNGKYRILHNHEVYLNILMAPLAKKNGFKYIITHSHTTSYSDKFINSIRNRILCMPLKKQADYFMACSKAAGKLLYGSRSVEDGKVFILNNAIDCKKFKYDESLRIKIRKQLGLENKIVIGHVGRFNAQKNHKFLLEIFDEILKLDKHSILLLVGDGPLFKEIKKISKEMRINDKIIFLGRRDNIFEILQGMDIFILPSLYEGLPVIGVEAQAAGLPCFMADTITNEVDINEVKYFSLKDDIEILAQKILHEYKIFNRRNIVEEIKNNGFEINLECKKLQKFYLSLKSIN